ncbi:MAG: hypothetical protein ACUVQI_09660 [Thermochromatium sp.]
MRLHPHTVMASLLALALLLMSTTPQAASPSASLSVERSSWSHCAVGFVQVDPDAAASTLTVRGTVESVRPTSHFDAWGAGERMIDEDGGKRQSG